MRKLAIGLALLLVFSFPSLANEKRELVLLMLEITDARHNHDLIVDSYIDTFASNPETASDEFLGYMREVMSWDALIEPMIQIYVETYTEEELQALIAFFESPAGQSFILKAPEVNQKSTKVMVQHVQSALAELQQQ